MQDINLNEVFLYCGITIFTWVKNTSSSTAFHVGIHALVALDQNPRSLSPYLLSGDAHVIPHVRENSGLNEEPFQAQSFASTLQLGSFTDAALDELQHTIVLLPTDLWRGRRDVKWAQRQLNK